MKKNSTSSKDVTIIRELRAEYRFDYRKAKPNRFAGQPGEDRVVVLLDPDVSKVFQTPDSVNKVLRGLIRNMPPQKKATEAKSRRPRTGP